MTLVFRWMSWSGKLKKFKFWIKHNWRANRTWRQSEYFGICMLITVLMNKDNIISSWQTLFTIDVASGVGQVKSLWLSTDASAKVYCPTTLHWMKNEALQLKQSSAVILIKTQIALIHIRKAFPHQDAVKSWLQHRFTPNCWTSVSRLVT